VRRGTWASRSKGSLTCVVHVVLVVGRVDVLAIPASKRWCKDQYMSRMEF
jgi:hypothetical protein